jgi:hypothetical protein
VQVNICYQGRGRWSPKTGQNRITLNVNGPTFKRQSAIVTRTREGQHCPFECLRFHFESRIGWSAPLDPLTQNNEPIRSQTGYSRHITGYMSNIPRLQCYVICKRPLSSSVQRYKFLKSKHKGGIGFKLSTVSFKWSNSALSQSYPFTEVTSKCCRLGNYCQPIPP